MPKKGYKQTELHRRHVSESCVNRKLTKEHIDKLKIKMIGNQCAKGCKHSVTANDSKSKMMIGNQRAKGYRHTDEWKKNTSKKMQGNTHSLGHKQTPEHIRKVLGKQGKSSLEIKFENLVNKLNLPYKFVGNGECFIARKCPDFINSNGEKIAVEVYYRKHKELFRNGLDEWKAERIRLLNQEGWEVIFFDETQVKEDIILATLKED